MTDLTCTTGHTSDGDPQLTAVGEIDLSNADTFRRAVTQAMPPHRRLLVDLTGVDYLDSAALAVLFAHVDRITVRVAPLNESLFTLCGLADLTTVEVVASPAPVPGDDPRGL